MGWNLASNLRPESRLQNAPGIRPLLLKSYSETIWRAQMCARKSGSNSSPDSGRVFPFLAAPCLAIPAPTRRPGRGLWRPGRQIHYSAVTLRKAATSNQAANSAVTLSCLSFSRPENGFILRPDFQTGRRLINVRPVPQGRPAAEKAVEQKQLQSRRRMHSARIVLFCLRLARE